MADDSADARDAQPESGDPQGSGKGGAHPESKVREVIDEVVEKIQEIAPRVGERLQEGAEAVAKKVQEVAPVVGERVRAGAGAIDRKVEEWAPDFSKKLHEGATRAGEIVDDLRDKIGDRGGHAKTTPHQQEEPGADGPPPGATPPSGS